MSRVILEISQTLGPRDILQITASREKETLLGKESMLLSLEKAARPRYAITSDQRASQQLGTCLPPQKNKK